jgi:flagellar protein FlgJ
MDSSYLNGLSDVFNDYSDIYNKNSSAGNIKNKLESTDYSKSTDDELMDACKEFEAYFVEQAFKAMQKMVPENEEGSSSDYMEYFGDTLVQEYAKSATNQGDGFGIANMLYEQMKRNYGLDTSTVSKNHQRT